MNLTEASKGQPTSGFPKPLPDNLTSQKNAPPTKQRGEKGRTEQRKRRPPTLAENARKNRPAFSEPPNAPSNGASD